MYRMTFWLMEWKSAQIALCDQNDKAWDLYYSAYTCPATFIMIKEWASKKTFRLLRERLPEWTESHFREIENVASCIELSAFTTMTNKDFPLDRKIYIVLNSLMKIYNVSKEERMNVISNVLSQDYCKVGNDLFERFAKKLDG